MQIITSKELRKSQPLKIGIMLIWLGLSTLAAPALAEPAGGYADLVAKLAPTVVSIEATQKASPADMKSLPAPFRDFAQQFGIPIQPSPSPDGTAALKEIGSGFIIDTKGDIVTNNHVIDGADTIKVTLADGKTYPAKLVGTDPQTDIAVLHIKAGKPLDAAHFGSSQAIRVGDDVVAIGDAFGLGQTVTHGIISAKARAIDPGNYASYLQTDAAINRGNSGGPLFNDAGDVVGMNTAIMSPSGGSVGIGFAIPSDLVKKVVSDLEQHGQVHHGWIGVQIKQVTSDVAAAVGLDKARGAIVLDVVPGSPAAKAGLKRGDIILSFATTAINQVSDLPRAVGMTDPGTSARIGILRAGKHQKLEILVGTHKAQKA